MKRTKITIDRKGQISFEHEGYTGTSCQDKTRAIIAALGAKDTGAVETAKPELYLTDQQEDHLTA